MTDVVAPRSMETSANTLENEKYVVFSLRIKQKELAESGFGCLNKFMIHFKKILI